MWSDQVGKVCPIPTLGEVLSCVPSYRCMQQYGRAFQSESNSTKQSLVCNYFCKHSSDPMMSHHTVSSTVNQVYSLKNLGAAIKMGSICMKTSSAGVPSYSPTSVNHQHRAATRNQHAPAYRSSTPQNTRTTKSHRTAGSSMFFAGAYAGGGGG